MFKEFINRTSSFLDFHSAFPLILSSVLCPYSDLFPIALYTEMYSVFPKSCFESLVGLQLYTVRRMRVNKVQRGVTGTARHRVNIICRGVTSTVRHAARSHSFVYISTS